MDKVEISCSNRKAVSASGPMVTRVISTVVLVIWASLAVMRRPPFVLVVNARSFLV
jgi:hypothetical protein